jgi:hypothetical protein
MAEGHMRESGSPDNVRKSTIGFSAEKWRQNSNAKVLPDSQILFLIPKTSPPQRRIGKTAFRTDERGDFRTFSGMLRILGSGTSMQGNAGGALGALLMGLAVLAAAAVVGVMIAGWYVADNVRVETTATSRGETVRVETPLGSVNVQQRAGLDARHLGVPVYPGAIREDPDSNRLASFEIEFGSTHKEFSVIAAEYSSSDPVERVTEFYRKQLPHWIISKKKHNGLRMEYTEEGYRRIVAIREKQGRTHIGVASVGEPAAN